MPVLPDLIADSLGISQEFLEQFADVQEAMGGSHLEGVKVAVQVKGLAELDQALTELPNELARRVIVGAVTEATEAFRQRMQELAPYDARERAGEKSGMHLVDGIRKEMRVGSHGVKGSWVHGKVGLHPDVFYGRFIEFGWTTPRGKRVEAHPFARPAFDETKYRALAIIQQRSEAGLAEAAAAAKR